MEVFVVEEPLKIDLIELLGSDEAQRANVFAWDSKAANVEGCLELLNPRQAGTEISVNNKQVPVLSLVDTLLARGWTKSTGRRVQHSPDSEKVFDYSKPMASRWYLQCLLAIDVLFQKKAKPFTSGRSKSFYRLLLHSPAMADPTMPASEAKRLLATITGDDRVLAELDGIPLAKRKRVTVQPPPTDDDDEWGHDFQPTAAEQPGSSTDPPGHNVAETDGPLSTPADSSFSSSSSTSGSSSSDTASEPDAEWGGDTDEPLPHPDKILGQKVYVEHRQGGGLGLSVRCNNPGHGRCRKYRSAKLDVATFGEMAPVYYLATWLAASHDDHPNGHGQWRPSRAQVRVYLAGHPM